VNVRVPIYWEFWCRSQTRSCDYRAARAEASREYYQPLPDHLPCLSHCCKTRVSTFMLLLSRHHPPTASPWRTRGSMKPQPTRTPTIAINTEVGRNEGLHDGELIWVENERGPK
jgi:molybdopterin-containing oxidoreductase family molybdopterin binding subunit